MKTSLKLMTAVVISLVGLGGSASLFAQAASASTPAPSQSQHAAEASDGDSETNDDAQDAAELARLQMLATITPQQAQQTAEQQMGKTADSVEIENDGGSLVYAVSFGQQDVKIDAGNGQVLYTDNQNDEDNAQQEASHPKSSIQLSGTDAGDGDGETNDDG
jgi:uncharacterized membrane protein YkoI